MSETPYVGRFAPSPTGPLHAGSLVAALASWLDARAHAGRWLVRIEDVDGPRCVPGADLRILDQLGRCGLEPDGPVLYQHTRADAYAAALATLAAAGRAYPCTCTRRDIERALARRGVAHARHAERVYPGTCRPPQPQSLDRASVECLVARGGVAWRLRVDEGETAFVDRRLGAQRQDVAAEVGDFVLRRADGLWAYQLAVVVDDAAQGVTDVVRGEDLLDNTARQIALQRALALDTPRYLHTPLVRAEDGEKLSKQHGATPLDLAEPMLALEQAARMLGLPMTGERRRPDVETWLRHASAAWCSLHGG